MAAVPVSDVVYVTSQESKAVCHLPHGLFHGTYHASLLHLQGSLHSNIATVYGG